MDKQTAKKLGYVAMFFLDPQEWHEDGWVIYDPSGEPVRVDGEINVWTDEESSWQDIEGLTNDYKADRD